MARIGALFLLLSLLTSCATTGVQTREVLRLPAEALPRAAEIKTVSFVNQTENYCGPSTLAMAMQWAGKPISVDELAPQVYVEGGKGSLQTDLISASRRNGLMAVPVEGMRALLEELAAGHPVIVLENLAFSWYPRWHYSIVLGYDLRSQELIMHSGERPFSRKYMNRFERGWKLGRYWGLVVLPPERLSVSGSALDHLRAAAGLEGASRIDEAGRAYLKILERWPGDLAALIGLGNVAYKKREYAQSVRYLKKALALYPQSHQARHNLSVAERARKN